VLTAMLAIRLLLYNLCQRATTGSITLVCWLFFAGLAMVLSNKMPAASFLGIVPLVAFMLGSLLDGMLRKRHTQLLFARLFGFLATVYLGCYFFYGLEVVAGFDRSYVLVAPLLLPMVAVLPLLASNVTRPHTSRWDLMLVLLPIGAICIAQPFIPGHNLDRPRGMNLVHRTVVGEDTALWQLETSTSAVDKEYAYRHDFGPVKIDLPGRGPQDIVAKPADSLPHGEVRLVESSKQDDGTLLRRSMQLEVPVDVRQLTLFLPANLVFNTVRVNGKLALQNPAPLPAGRSHRGIVLNRPKAGQVRVEITSSSSNPGSANSLAIPVRTRSSLPESVLQPQLQGWPLDAQAQHQGHRSEVEYLLQPDW
ncbi:MAG TPA: hypothetical protein VFG52_12180, partial [Xanthomonadales bacterium]|nr:hypothetical protein [Xanthomonadales bacterium]